MEEVKEKLAKTTVRKREIEREGEVVSYRRVSMSWLEELKINKNWSGGYKN